MNVRFTLVALVSAGALAACGSGSTSTSHLALQLTSSEAIDGAAPRIAMRAGETRTVVVVAIGADGTVKFAGRELPAFAKLDGPILTLSPQRQDAGDYSLSLSATDGHDSVTAELALSVGRENSAPSWASGNEFSFGGFGDDTNGMRYIACPGPATCTAAPDSYVEIHEACDAEGDGIRVDVEVVPRGGAFEGKPTFSATAPAIYPPPVYGNCPSVQVHLPGLAPERSYDFAVRVTDQFGAIAAVPGAPDGWFHRSGMSFDQGPCTSRQCACVPSRPAGAPWSIASSCTANSDCCSGACD